MKKTAFPLALLTGLAGIPWLTLTPPAQATPRTAQWTGTIAAAPWTKTTESFCQGGSDYYVLVVNAQRYILNSERDRPYAQAQSAKMRAIQQQLRSLVGKPVVLKGELISRTLQTQELCPNPMAQCVKTAITCRWIRVSEVRGR